MDEQEMEFDALFDYPEEVNSDSDSDSDDYELLDELATELGD